MEIAIEIALQMNIKMWKCGNVKMWICESIRKIQTPMQLQNEDEVEEII